MSDVFELIKDLQPVEGLVFEALIGKPAYHSLLLLYQQLLRHSDGRVWSNKQIADSMGMSETVVKRGLRILRRLGLIVIDGDRKTRLLIAMTHYSTTDDRMPRVLKGISNGRVILELETGRVVDTKTDREFDAEHLKLRVVGAPMGRVRPKVVDDPGVVGDPSLADESDLVTASEQTSLELHRQNGSTPVLATPEFSISSSSFNRSRSTKSSISTPINKSILEGEFYRPAETDKKNPYWLPVTADHLPLNSKFKTQHDPFRADIEAAQAYANERFGIKHTLLDGAGKQNERYGVLFRALNHFGFTLEDLKRGLDNVLKHHYWAGTNVRDTTKLFRNLATAEELINYKAPLNQKTDLRHLDLREVRGPDKILESFEF
jgi:biotin operon repressor